MPTPGPETNAQIFDQRMRELQGDNPEPKPLHPLLRRPQLVFAVVLVVVVVAAGLLSSAGKAHGTKVTAEVVLCGGPGPNTCRVGSYRSCPPCVSSSSLTIIGPGKPAPVYRVALVDGRRATLNLPPRTYVFKVTGTGKHNRNAVLAVRRVRVAARKSVTIKLVMPTF